MNKKHQTTFQFPIQIQKEYHQLMMTKENFLKNLTSAEQRKLATLYEQLEDVWILNNSELLQENLNQKYLELRGIQKSIENLSKNNLLETKNELNYFEMNLEKDLILHIEIKEKELMQKKETLKAKKISFENIVLKRTKNMNQNLKIIEQELNNKQLKNIYTRQTKLNKSIETWKNDILEKEAKLIQNQNQSIILSQNLQSKTQILEALLIKKEKLLTKLQQNQADLKDYQLILETRELQNKMISQELKKTEAKLRADFQEREMILKQNLLKKKENLNKDLKIFIKESKLKLRQEILEKMNIPENSKTFLKTWSLFPISSMHKKFINDTKKRGTALQEKLTKIGMTEHDFFELMDKFEI